VSLYEVILRKIFKKDYKIVHFGEMRVNKVLFKLKKQKVDWGLRLLNVGDSHKRTRGAGIKIAYLDTGISYHEDLKNNIRGHRDFTGTNDFLDRNGHGTFSQGVGSAVDNNVGVIGVAPESLIYSGKVLGNNGKGDLRWLARGINWAIEEKVDIINMSLGWGGRSYKPVRKAVLRAYKKGIVLVAAAGNEGRRPGNTINYPARYPEVIAVTAISKYKRRTDFSSRGPQAEISAPGCRITSTWLNNSYAILDGTSFASPFIAGIVALMKARSGSLTVQQIRQKLQQTATDAGSRGRDNEYGFGLVNPSKVAKRNGVDIEVLV